MLTCCHSCLEPKLWTHLGNLVPSPASLPPPSYLLPQTSWPSLLVLIGQFRNNEGSLTTSLVRFTVNPYADLTFSQVYTPVA